MKVFSFSGNLVYNYGERKEFNGYFYQKNNEEIEGYMIEKGKKALTEAIKGIYIESTGQLLLIKTTVEEDYSPNIYMFIFQNVAKDGWLSLYNRYDGRFSAYTWVKNGVVYLNNISEVSVTQEEAQTIQSRYLSLCEAATQLSRHLIKNIGKYKMLFNHIKLSEKGTN